MSERASGEQGFANASYAKQDRTDQRDKSGFPGRGVTGKRTETVTGGVWREEREGFQEGGELLPLRSILRCLVFGFHKEREGERVDMSMHVNCNHTHTQSRALILIDSSV